MTMNHHDSDRERREIEKAEAELATLKDRRFALSSVRSGRAAHDDQEKAELDAERKYIRDRIETVEAVLPRRRPLEDITLVLHADGCVTWESGA